MRPGLIYCAGFLALLACVSLLPAPLRAQAGVETPDRHAEYESLIDRALAAFEAARYPEARGLFEAAHALQPSARTLRGLGMTAFQQRDYDTAQQELQAAMRSTLRPLTPVQRVEVGELLSWMETGLGSLELTVSPEHAIAEIDGRQRTPGRILLDPGEHRLHVRAQNHASQTRVFSLELGAPLALRVALQPVELASVAAAPPSSPTREAPRSALGGAQQRSPHVRDASAEPTDASVFSRWWFWTAVGVVAAAAVVGVVAIAAPSGDPEYEPGGIGGVVRTLWIEPAR